MTNKEKIISSNLVNLQTEKQSRKILLEKAWLEHKERRDTEANLGMYIALETPKAKIDEIVVGVLQQLVSDSEKGRAWAEDWGRVVVAVHPTKLEGVNLMASGRGTKSYVKLETTRLINTSEVIEQSRLDGKNLIVVNESPVTLEGLVVEVVHLLDELIWRKFRKLKNNMNEVDAYEKAVRDVVDEGVKLVTASEEEILCLKKQMGDLCDIRLYGSKAIGSVPLLMGGVLKLDDKENIEIPMELKLNEEIGKGAGKFEANIEGKIGFGAGVTLGKELHVGHLMLLASAELGRLGVGGEQIRLFSNDTGPRVAGMLARLAVDKKMTASDVACYLRSGEIEINDVVSAYRSRIMEGEVFDEAQKETDLGGGLLSVMERKTTNDLERVGLSEIRLVRESEYVFSKGEKVVDKLSPEWGGYGFSVARSGRGIMILKKQGRLSATGKVATYLIDSLSELDSMVLIDGEADSFDAIDLTSFLGLKTMMVPGVGVGIGGKIGSGSGGELPSIEKICDEFNGTMIETLNYFVLSTPQTSILDPNSITVTRFYDFSSKKAVIEGLKITSEELVLFKTRIKRLVGKLINSDAGETEAGKNKRRIDSLPNDFYKLMSTPANEFLGKFGKSDMIRESPGFIGELNRINIKIGSDLRRSLLEILLKGKVKTNLDLIILLREKGVFPNEGKLPNKIVNIESRYLNIVLKQGYRGEEAMSRVIEYQEGKLILSKRYNLYHAALLSLLNLVEEISTWEAGDASMVREMIFICLEKLGINI